MILYVELWNARLTWLALSQQRGEYMAQLAPAIGQLPAAGVEIVGWGINDTETPYRSNHQYLAVWKLPDQSAVTMLEAAVEAVTALFITNKPFTINYIDSFSDSSTKGE